MYLFPRVNIRKSRPPSNRQFQSLTDHKAANRLNSGDPAIDKSSFNFRRVRRATTYGLYSRKLDNAMENATVAVEQENLNTCSCKDADIDNDIEYQLMEGSKQKRRRRETRADEDERDTDVPKLDLTYPENDLGFRLSMIGLNMYSSENNVVDELRSDLYSSTLDLLRSLVTNFVPQTEEMVSKAIITALNADYDDSRTSSISQSEPHAHVDAMQLEINAMKEAYHWAKFRKCRNSHPDEDDLLQAVVDSIVFYVLQGQLTAYDACRILSSTTIMMGVASDTTQDPNTLIITGMNKNKTTDDLHHIFGRFGSITRVNIAENGGLGICQFANISSLKAAVDSAGTELLLSLGPGANVTAVGLRTVLPK